jgi:hypothetical protein
MSAYLPAVSAGMGAVVAQGTVPFRDGGSHGTGLAVMIRILSLNNRKGGCLGEV